MGVEHVRLGKHGVLVSNLCLGTMNFGWHTSEEESFKIMDRALELGINFFDTADVYGWDVEHGLTEEIIGRWFAQGGGRRDATVLATKVYNPVTRKANLPEVNSDGRSLSAYKIRKHCEGSFRRMQTEWIDLYQMHHVDRECPWDETWQAFGSLVNQGKVVYVGSSNFAGWDIATACQEASKTRHDGAGQRTKHLPSEQPHGGTGSDPRLPSLWTGLHSLESAGRRPAGRGAGKTWTRAGAKAKILRKRSRKIVTSWRSMKIFAATIGHPPGEVALAWLLHNPIVTAPIIGPRTIEQLESAVRAAEISLDEATLQRLDEIFPGPGGEAPKAYSW